MLVLSSIISLVYLDNTSTTSAFLLKDFKFCSCLSISSFNKLLYFIIFLNKLYFLIQLKIFHHSFVNFVKANVPRDHFEIALIEWTHILHLKDLILLQHGILEFFGKLWKCWQSNFFTIRKFFLTFYQTCLSF